MPSPSFAFLVHPRTTRDLLASSLGRVLHQQSRSETEFIAKCCSLPPLVVGDLRFGFSPCCGELICVMRMPQDIVSGDGFAAVVQAAEVAAARGNVVVGLGALTAPVTRGGLRLLPHIPEGVTVTNGNAYTAAVARDNVMQAAEAIGASAAVRVAVVGCTGAVGVAASQLLALTGFDLILIGRSAERAASALGGTVPHAVFSGAIDSVEDAAVILLLTNHPTARLTPELVAPGSIVIDMAEPANVRDEDRNAFRERDVQIVDGGFVRVPDYSCTFDIAAPTPADTFACLAETYLIAREGIREHSVGPPTAERALFFERIARRHGVRPAWLGLDGAAAGSRVPALPLSASKG